MFGSGAPRNTLSDMPTLETNLISAACPQQFFSLLNKVLRIDKNGFFSHLRKKRKRCGVCDGCVSDECEKCRFCLDKPKYGGSGKMKKCCTKWQYLKLVSKSRDHTHTSTLTKEIGKFPC